MSEQLICARSVTIIVHAIFIRNRGAGEVGIWRELQEQNTEHLRHADKLLFWSKRAWFIIWAGTLYYLPPIGCELLLAIITEKEDQRDQNTSVEDKLSSLRALPTEYHNDQLNLCRYYSSMGATILVEGLRLRELNSGHAHDIAEIIWKNAEENNTLLSTAYSGILKGSRAMEKNSLEPDGEKAEDDWSPPIRRDEAEDLAGFPPRKTSMALECTELLCEGDR